MNRKEKRDLFEKCEALEEVMGPGTVAFLDSDYWRERFCAGCPAHGDEDECPCGLRVGGLRCYKLIHYHELLGSLVSVETESTRPYEPLLY